MENLIKPYILDNSVYKSFVKREIEKNISILYKNQTLRIKIINNNLWFLAIDVANILNITNLSKMILNIEEYESFIFEVDLIVKKENMLHIEEFGIYTILKNSNNEQSFLFFIWLARVAVPKILIKLHQIPKNSQLKYKEDTTTNIMKLAEYL